MPIGPTVRPVRPVGPMEAVAQAFGLGLDGLRPCRPSACKTQWHTRPNRPIGPMGLMACRPVSLCATLAWGKLVGVGEMLEQEENY